MDFSKLTWDSNFFGLNIGKLTLKQNDVCFHFDVEKYQDYDLVYVFVPHGLKIPFCGLELVDSKVIYRKTELNRMLKNPNIHLFVEKTPTQELYELALQSGEYSRFKLDEKFPTDSYEKLYRCWIEQSVSKTIADDVLCYYLEDRIIGMVTVSVNDRVGHIGLVAVDAPCRNMGIGSALLDAVDSYFFERNAIAIEVPTQLNNRSACLWYEKNGYEVHTITDIYHWWFS